MHMRTGRTLLLIGLCLTLAPTASASLVETEVWAPGAAHVVLQAGTENDYCDDGSHAKVHVVVQVGLRNGFCSPPPSTA